MRWAAMLQKELLEVAWPEMILSWPDCEEKYMERADGQEALLWKGLRVRIGMACGKAQSRKPLNTGRTTTRFSATDCPGIAASCSAPG